MGIPTNAVDAASALADGSLGVIEIIKIGDLTVSALQGLSGGDEMRITDKPVQSGFAVSDAAVRMPVERTLDIVLANPDLAIGSVTSAVLSGDPGSLGETFRDKRDELYAYFEEKEILTYQTHESVYESAMIQSITPYFDVDENWECWIGAVHFKEIKQLVVAGAGGLFDQAKEAVG
ncbi:MAG: hypothetical protein GY847_28840 [Proteobacteria bacterium]|nr:hypothetical protein [Pseudomonadota bacterium]